MIENMNTNNMHAHSQFSYYGAGGSQATKSKQDTSLGYSESIKNGHTTHMKQSEVASQNMSHLQRND